MTARTLKLVLVVAGGLFVLTSRPLTLLWRCCSMNRRWSSAGVVSMLLLVVASTGFAAAERPASGLARAIAAQEAHTDSLLGRSGVVGTAVGLDANGVPVVKIYTESGNVGGLPHSLDGVATDVEVTGKLLAQNWVSNTGVSSGTERLMIYRGSLYCTTGTLGAVVSDGSSNPYALSNAHVYALEGSKPSGAVTSGANGDRALEPGRVDMTAQACGSQTEIDAAAIGNLWSYVPITISRKASNTIDAAIAKLTTAPTGTAVPAACGSYVPATTTVLAANGMFVKKCGRTTGLTTGSVTGVNATVIISYDAGQARFVNQIVVTGTNGSAFSDGGDSGSLIVTNDGSANPVALLFAGSPSTTIGNPIGDVLKTFNVHIQ